MALSIVSMLCSTRTSNAQSISIGLRGTGALPTGAFTETSGGANEALLSGAKAGFGYGLDLGLSLGMFGLYAGFDQIDFACENSRCTNDGLFNLQGVSVGARLMPNMTTRLRPFLKGGVTFNTLSGAYGNSAGNRLTTDRAPGFELSVGGNIALAGMLALTPQLRYVGQNLKANIPGVSVPGTPSDGVNYFTFDLGLSFIPSFGAVR